MSKYIILNLEASQYFPGDTIRGRAICQFKNSEEIRKIRIRFTGKENTKWKTGSGKSSTTHTGENKLFSHDQIVHGEGTINPGDYPYEFGFLIPLNIPSSFSHQYGKIKYSIKVTVDRPWGFDYEIKKDVTIVAPLRLEDIPHFFQEPMYLSDEKTLCCSCFGNANIQLDVNLQRRAIRIGDTVNFVATCKNMSNTRVNALKVYLNMKLKFTTHPETILGPHEKYASENIVESSYNGVEAHNETTSHLEFLIPPSTMVPNFTGALLFSCEPRLKFVAVISGCHRKLVLKTIVAPYHISRPQASPINYQNDVNMQMQPQMHSTTLREIGFFFPESDRHISDMALPPPTYEEASKNFN